MLTVINKDTEVKDKDGNNWYLSEIWKNNTYINNKLNEEAIGIALTSVFTFDSLFRLISSLATNILRAKYASLMVLERDTLYLKYANHIPEEIKKECRVNLGTGISGWVSLRGEHVLVKDIEHDKRFARMNHKRYTGKSFISMPLVANGKVIGVINVNDKTDGQIFNEKDVNALKIISKYAGIAIRNAKLIEKTKKLTIVQELEKEYYDKSRKFLPVTLKSLKLGTYNKSELYLENNVNGENNYVLYWKGGERLFVNEKREEFIRKNINKLYVPKNGRKQYLRFIETNLEKVLEDESSSSKERFDVARDVAINIINDLNVMADELGNIERAKQWVNTIMDLIHNNRNNYTGLVNVKRNDLYIHEHSANVTITSLKFAYHLGINIEELGELGLGLLLQDTGMRNVDSQLINKPAKLNREEYSLIKKHSELGYQMLLKTGQLSADACLIALLHHENYNGTGYPYGFKEKDINYYARIARIVDVYSALTSDRPYASAVSAADACMIMKRNMDGMFDPEILDRFMDFLKSVGIIAKPRFACV